MPFLDRQAPFACSSLFSQAVICFPIWMNIFDSIFNEKFTEWIFLIQLNNFLARFNVKMNIQNISPPPTNQWKVAMHWRTTKHVYHCSNRNGLSNPCWSETESEKIQKFWTGDQFSSIPAQLREIGCPALLSWMSQFSVEIIQLHV